MEEHRGAHARLLSTEGQRVLGFDVLRSFSVLFGHIKRLAGQWLLKQTTNQSSACPTDVREGRHSNFFFKNKISGQFTLWQTLCCIKSSFPVM